MKKILLLVVTLGIVFIATAQEGPLVISADGVRKLELGENMKVTLVHAGKHQPELKASTAFLKKLNVSVFDGTMRINRNAKLSKNDTIMVVVDALESLTLRQNTQVNTEGILHGKHINVFVEPGAVARLLTTGKVAGFSSDDVEVTVDKRPIRLKMNAKVMQVTR